MKRKLLLFCFCFISLRAFCQQFNLGIIAGGNVSTFIPPASEEPEGKYSALVGVHAGVIFQVAMGSIYIQPGAVYESIGGKLTGEDVELSGGAFSETNSLQYIQIPMNILYHTQTR